MRTIYAPDGSEKRNYRIAAFPIMQELSKRPEAIACQHGFTQGRSAVTNAMQHIGFAFTLCMDLKDFFDSVGISKLVREGLQPEDANKVCYQGATRQGLPSSPTCANLAACGLDRSILAFIAGRGCVYTRYADDLAISGNDKDFLLSLRQVICNEAERLDFTVNASKTRLQDAKYGNRIICGVAVGPSGISVPRSFKRKLRAAKFSRPGTWRTRGLANWAQLIPPHNKGGVIQRTYVRKMAKQLLSIP